ncbi:TPA: hypothetical protein SIF59_004272 [Escherichia coli]|nr:hypothetical protein [Escherichia coli]
MIYPWTNVYASDIETTGLIEQMMKQEHPRLHNIGYIDALTKEETCIQWTNRKAIQDFLDSGPTMVMHNGATFDKEALAFLGFDVSKITIIDTLYISWYLQPRRPKHGLEGYGEEFGVPKPVIEDWENQTQEEYDFRVMQDCRIQLSLWEQQYSQLLAIYRSPEEVKRFVEYLMSKSRQQVIQQRTRWKLNIEKAKVFQAKVEPMVAEKEIALEASMPRVPIYKLQERPAKCHRKDGTLSAAGIKWKALCDSNNLDWKDPSIILKICKGYNPPNSGSHVQLKDWLFSLGWEPETFKFVRDKETNETRQIPQVTVKDDDGIPDICPSLHKLAEANPGKGVEHLIGLGVYRNRLSIVSGWLRDVSEDGFLTARCGGLTNTLRLKHRGLVNIPSERVFGGKELREMLEAENDDYEQLGSDLSSLEDRCKHHFQWQYDPEYVKKQLAEDYDAHLAIGVIGGFITEEVAQRHKDKVEKCLLRPMFKTTNYACQYGAGIATIMRQAKCSWEVAEKLHSAYWRLNWSVKEVAKNTTVKTVDGQMWQQNPINGFWYSLRNEKDRFSTLCQGTGSYVFDIWCNEVIAICNERYGCDPKLSGQFHDELILQVRKGHRDLWKNLVGVEAMARTNAKLNLNRDVACDVQFGDNYSEIH